MSRSSTCIMELNYWAVDLLVGPVVIELENDAF